MKNVVYKMITDKVIEGLKNDGLKWFKPWKNKDGEYVMPKSYTSKECYSGINYWMLSAAIRHYGWESSEFITFKQASALGGKIKKGAKSQEVVYYSVMYFHNDKCYKSLKALQNAGLTPKTKGVTEYWHPLYFRVFNLDQTEGVEMVDLDKVKEEPNIFESIPNADKVYDNYNNAPKLVHDRPQAFYNPSKDLVNMPTPKSFVDSDSYYKTLFHELVHSTGHKSRLNREGVTGIVNFGTETYSKEELVAEIGSLFLVEVAGLNPKDNVNNSQAYINGWCKALKDNEKWVLQASSQAQKSIKLILNK